MTSLCRAGPRLAELVERVATARAHLGLPRYRSHDALTDALACADLYLAQVATLSGGRRMTLSSLLHT